MTRSDPRFEVPPEYADVYEKAFRSRSGGSGGHHGGSPYAGSPPPGSGRGRLGLVVIGLVLLVVVAVAAYELGRSSPRDDSARGRNRVDQAPAGTVDPVRPSGATSTCPAPVVSDAAGRPVSFAAGNAIDTDRSTSWACAGAATGAELVVTLPEESEVTRVGLLPTLAASGIVLNRITAVEWVFDDGSSVRQVLDPDDRAVAQVQQVAPKHTRTVRLRLDSVTPGPGDLTALASVFLWGAPDDG